jgi:drug/metabolite transporter (DMT)-like permease
MYYTCCFHLLIVPSYQIPVLTVTAWVFASAFPMSLSVASFFLKDFIPSQIPRIAWIGVLYAGFVIGATSFSISAFANKYSTPTTAAIYNTAAPLFSIIFAIIFNGKIPTPLALIGAAGITVGVLLVVVARHRESKKDELKKLEAEQQQEKNNNVEEETTDII